MEACSHTDLMIQIPRWDVGFRRPSLVPGQGPILTWRALAQTTRPPLGDWDLALGDIELF